MPILEQDCRSLALWHERQESKAELEEEAALVLKNVV
jgi:hypothetical protein